jgi:hypothetical protein
MQVSVKLMWNRYSLRRRFRRSRPEFSYAVFLRVDVESLLREEEVSTRQTRVPVRNGYNF